MLILKVIRLKLSPVYNVNNPPVFKSLKILRFINHFGIRLRGKCNEIQYSGNIFKDNTYMIHSLLSRLRSLRDAKERT